MSVHFLGFAGSPEPGRCSLLFSDGPVLCTFARWDGPALSPWTTMRPRWEMNPVDPKALQHEHLHALRSAGRDLGPAICDELAGNFREFDGA